MKKIILTCALLAATGASAWAQVEPRAASWKTWVLSSSSQLRLPPPSGRDGTAGEMIWLRDFTRAGDPLATRQMQFWSAGSPSYRWVELATSYVERRPLTNPRNTRFLALLNVAIYDATIAAWDSKYAHNRPRPSKFDPTFVPRLETPQSPSYPSEHAVAAGAASTILAYIYPSDAQYFADLADEAMRSQLYAGRNFPSDAIAGLELGRAVAKLVIDRAQTDGSSAVWTGTVPQGPGLWNGTNPNEPLAGTWKAWSLASNSAFRPGPPVPYDSPQKAAELAEIKNFPRDFNSNQRAFFWQSFEGIFTFWYQDASQRIFEYGLENNPPRAARIYALMSIAHHDALIAGWEAKYNYWAIRPFQLDPALTTIFPTPNHPSYPAAHGFVSGSMAHMLAYLFPNEAEFIESRAAEAAESRMWAGIHYRSDITAGLSLGRAVADTVIGQARQDGSE